MHGLSCASFESTSCFYRLVTGLQSVPRAESTCRHNSSCQQTAACFSSYQSQQGTSLQPMSWSPDDMYQLWQSHEDIPVPASSSSATTPSSTFTEPLQVHQYSSTTDSALAPNAPPSKRKSFSSCDACVSTWCILAAWLHRLAECCLYLADHVAHLDCDHSDSERSNARKQTIQRYAKDVLRRILPAPLSSRRKCLARPSVSSRQSRRLGLPILAEAWTGRFKEHTVRPPKLLTA